MSRRRRLLAATLAVAAAVLALTGIPDAADAGENPLFTGDTMLKAVLTAPITQAYAQADLAQRIYMPGQWSFVDASGEIRKLDVSIRTRGNFRREYCDLPPLQLNFRRKQVRGTLFAGQDKLKLVSPCGQQARYQQYVLLEYLAYKIFEVVTDRSFRTRMIRLSYIDSDDKLDPWTALTFVIEDDKDMADRLGLVQLHVNSVKFAALDRPQTALMELTQFLIGNNDYSLLKGGENEECCHNVVMLAAGEDGSRIPVPFDFDASGLVNASYASPPAFVPIRDVRDRYYLGFCQPPEVLDQALDKLRAEHDAILALVTGMKEMSRKSRVKSVEYVEDFYRILGDPQRLETEVKGQCRGAKLLEKLMRTATDPT
ncbi:MAG: hypothetical protein WB812_16660 [Woeseiaceae bacterium]